MMRGAKVMAEKKYIIDNAELMAEWDWEKNDELELDPKTVTLGSGKKAWWKCKKGHKWQAAVNDRKKGHGCKICGREKAMKTRAESILKDGEHTFFNLFSELMSEWDWEKNEALGLAPNRISPGSGKKAWWKCENGHEWQAKILSRSNGTGCPYCNNVKVLIGYNDLLTLNPQVAEEWHSTKNGTLLPQDFFILEVEQI